MKQATIRAWGNSQGIRLPKDVLDEMKLKVSDILEISVEDDKIVLSKQFRHKSFEERLAEYNGKLTIADFDWGEPKGKELL
jgi:antitoxin MazE